MKEIISPLKKQNSKYLCILLMFILVQGCAKHEYNIEEIDKMKPTHVIISDSLLELFNKFDNLGKYDDNSDIYVLYIKKDKQNYNTSIAKTSFSTFKRERLSLFYFKELKGYSFYKRTPILLFGDIDSEIFKPVEIDKEILYEKNDNSGKIIR